METDVDQTWQTWARGDPLEVINFWWWCGSACGFRITFYFLHHCGIGGFWTFVSISRTINGRFVPHLEKWLTPTASTTFWDRSWIRVNPKIPILIPDNFSFKFWCWQRRSENPDSNPGSLLVQILVLAEVCALWVLFVISVVDVGREFCRDSANVDWHWGHSLDQTSLVRRPRRRQHQLAYRYVYNTHTDRYIGMPIDMRSLAAVCLKKTRPLRLVWHNFTNAQHLSIIFRALKQLISLIALIVYLIFLITR